MWCDVKGSLTQNQNHFAPKTESFPYMSWSIHHLATCQVSHISTTATTLWKTTHRRIVNRSGDCIGFNNSSDCIDCPFMVSAWLQTPLETAPLNLNNKQKAVPKLYWSVHLWESSANIQIRDWKNAVFHPTGNINSSHRPRLQLVSMLSNIVLAKWLRSKTKNQVGNLASHSAMWTKCCRWFKIVSANGFRFPRSQINGHKNPSVHKYVAQNQYIQSNNRSHA